MKLEGSVVWYLLSQLFRDVRGEGISRKSLYDYPILYDDSSNMSGHTVLVPSHERPKAGPQMENVLCVCVSEGAACSARDSGLPIVMVEGDVTFQHLYNRMQALFVRGERFETQLRTLVDAYAGFQSLVDACFDTTGFACVLVDEHYRIVCRAPAVARDGAAGEKASSANLFDAEFVDLLMASRGYRNLRSSRNVYVVPGADDLLMKNVFCGERLVGSIAMQHRGDVLSARFIRFMLDYLEPFTREMYERIGSFGIESPGRDQVKAALAEACKGTHVGCVALERALRAEGHAEGSSYEVVHVKRSFTNEGEEGHAYLIRRLESSLPRSYAFTVESDVFLLVDVGGSKGNERDEMSQTLSLATRENLSKVGISRLFSDMRDLAGATVQAKAALEYGSAVDPTTWSYRFGDYALAWLGSRAFAGISPECALHPAITVLQRYDDAQGTELLRTLRTFVECRYNATLAAERLFVARSTLLNRLERIQQLVRVDLEGFESRAYLALSFIATDYERGM